MQRNAMQRNVMQCDVKCKKKYICYARGHSKIRKGARATQTTPQIAHFPDVLTKRAQGGNNPPLTWRIGLHVLTIMVYPFVASQKGPTICVEAMG